MTWPNKPLSALGKVQTGSTPSTTDSTFWGIDVPFVTPSELDQSKPIYHTPRMLSFAGAQQSRLLKTDSVLVCCIGSLGKIGIAGQPLVSNQQINAVEFDTNLVFPKFGFYACRLLKNKLFSMAPATTIAIVSKSKFEKLEIPVPPLPEQKRIAAILDQADALRTTQRETLAQLDSLAQAIFIEMFGDPAQNPNKWPTKTVGQISTKFSDGPFGSNLKSSHYVENGIRVVRLQNIGVGKFIDEDKAYVSERHYEKLKKHDCKPGDVLIGTMGDPNLRACIQPEWLQLALNKADCVQFRPNLSLVTSQFVCALLNHPSTSAMAQDLMHGQTRVRISMGRLRDFVVPIPPLSKQKDFANQINCIEKSKVQTLSQLTELNTLFTSLQHRAFRGEL